MEKVFDFSDLPTHFLNDLDFENDDMLYQISAAGTRDKIVELIHDFEENLDEAHQAAGRFISSGESIPFFIEDIGYYNPYLIVFYGKLTDGSDVQLVQHHTQVNVLLSALKRLDTSKPRRSIHLNQSQKKY